MAIRVHSGGNPLNYARLMIGSNAVPLPIINGEPFTVFCRILPNNQPGPLGSTIVKFDRIPPGFGGNLDYFLCDIRNIAFSDQVLFSADASRFSSDERADSDPHDLGVPYNLGFVFVNDSERHMIVDGVLEGSDFVLSLAWNGQEGVIMFCGYTSTVGTYNAPLNNACVADITIWQNVKTAGDLLPLNDFGVDPTTIDRNNIILSVPLVDVATMGEAWEYVSNPGFPTAVPMTVEPGDGSFEDESECFPIEPECPVSDFPVSGVDLTYPPCKTNWTQCVRIVRRDDLSFHFTTLDRDLEFRGNTYLTCNSITASALQAFGELSEVGSTELSGLLATGAVDEADLYGGLFDDAFVEIFRVPYEGESETAGDIARRLGAGWVGKISQSARGYKMEVLGPGARLDQRPIVKPVTPQCRWTFGDDNCGVDVAALATPGVVASGTNRGNFIAEFAVEPIGSGTGEVPSSGELSASFADGKILWLTGVNAGQTTEVKSVDFENGEVILWAQAAFVPEAGDTFDLMPGCPQDWDSCRNLYDNGRRFGGFPHVPGQDAIIRSPNVKQS